MVLIVDSPVNFWLHWMCWKFLGAGIDRVDNKILYIAYALVLNALISFCYPVHLLMSVFRNGSIGKDVKNLALSVTSTACSIKFLIYAANIKKVVQMENILRQLDARVLKDEHRRSYHVLQKPLRYIFYSFGCIYVPCGIVIELAFIFQAERALLLPAWLPFDCCNSTLNYVIANIYQFSGIAVFLVQSYASDCFPPIALCLISIHIKLLGLRLARIGHDKKSMAENDNELHRCILDQQNLYMLFKTVEDFISMPMFIQLAVTAFNMCISISAFLFFITDPLDKVYFVFYFFAMALQIFPTCYYGTDIELQFSKLHYAAFSCNWPDQTRMFKKNLIFLMERSLMKTTALAAGMLRIHLDTFFSTCKAAYSLLAVIIRKKN